VLTGFLGFSARPAAGHCRRPSHFTVAVALAVTLTGGCREHQEPDVFAARLAMRTAIRRLRPMALEKSRYLERLVADAEITTARETYAPFWRPLEGSAQASWLRAVRAASEATREANRKRSTARERYLVLLPQAQDDVARARAEIRETGMGRREAAALERALTSLATARRFTQAGDYLRGAEKLLKAREFATVVHKGWSSVHARFTDPRLIAQWHQWAEAAIEESRVTGETVILVDKLHRRLLLYREGLRMVSFPAELGANGLRRKEHAGDRATPEGRYRVVQLKQNSSTKYYKALLINYPNDDDRERFSHGKRRGTIPTRAGIGNLIEIHGEGGEGRDWTDGCVALANSDMDTVFARANIGTSVTIVGRYDH